MTIVTRKPSRPPQRAGITPVNQAPPAVVTFEAPPPPPGVNMSSDLGAAFSLNFGTFEAPPPPPAPVLPSSGGILDDFFAPNTLGTPSFGFNFGTVPSPPAPVLPPPPPDPAAAPANPATPAPGSDPVSVRIPAYTPNTRNQGNGGGLLTRPAPVAPVSSGTSPYVYIGAASAVLLVVYAVASRK